MAGTWTYTYDAVNQLRSVRRSGTLIARYGYDVLGRRIVKRVYSAASGGLVHYRRYVYRGGHVAFETDSAAPETVRLAYEWGIGTDDLVALRDSTGTTYYAVTDKLGSVRSLVRRDGTWIRSLWYSPYGALVAHDSNASAGSPELRNRWTGREFDRETGLYFHRARYYDPAVGRFVQEDPLAFDARSNWYAYVEGRALEARGPTGMDFVLPEGCYISYGVEHWVRHPDGTVDHFIVWYAVCFDNRTISVIEPLDGGGGGGGGGGGVGGAAPGGSASQGTRAMAYRAVQQCPPANRGFLTQLETELAVATGEGLERGGHYMVRAGSVTLTMSGTNRDSAHVTIPPRPGAAGFWHVHEDTPGTRTWPQGPSGADSAAAVALGGPMWVRSRDSVFLVTPAGNTASAVGCAAP